MILHDDKHSDQHALRFTVANLPRKPKLRFELAVERTAAGHFAIGGAVKSDWETLLYFSNDDWFDDPIVAITKASFPAIVPRIRSEDVETTDDWAKFFMRALDASDFTPLFPGTWEITRGRAFANARIPDADVFDPGWGNTIPSRRLTDTWGSRVKWWRKLAEQEKLPPILAYYCSTMNLAFILDGHDRLLAAELADVKPTVFCLSLVRYESWEIPAEELERTTRSMSAEIEGQNHNPKTIDGINRALIKLYDNEHRWTISRGYAYSGGVPALRLAVDQEFAGEKHALRSLCADMFL